MKIKEIALRKSVRRFEAKDVPPETLTALLCAARAAPSGKNKQPWRFLVYRGRAKAALLCAMEAGLERERDGPSFLPASRGYLADAWRSLSILRQAPVLVLVIDPYAASPFVPLADADARFGELVDTLSLGAAIQNLLLEATAQGLGAVWIANTCFAYNELTAVMETEGRLVSAVALGYPAEQPPARPRKPLSALVEYRG